jgi:putative Holliday junction resolvase
MGIDFGKTRIGLSMSDPLRIIATPYSTLNNDENIWVSLQEIILREGIELLVVGMPTTLRGEKSRKAKEVESFIDDVKTRIGINVITWDERFTTSIARQTLLDMNTKKKGRNAKSGRLDSMAAALILQGYLDSIKKSLVC